MHTDHSYLLWVALVAYAVHMMEETIYNWHDWVRTVFKLNAEWSEFYLVNAFVIVLGAGCAMVGWKVPAFALIFPAFMVVNALFFHIAPVIKTGIFSPGVITAAVLFLPVTSWVYFEAARDGVLNTQNLVISSISGFVLMLFPIVLQMTKSASFVIRYRVK